MSNASYTAYYKKASSLLRPPVYCPTLYLVGGLFELPNFIAFDPENLTISYFTNETQTLGSYNLIVCENFNSLEVSFISQFKLEVEPESGFGDALTN